MEGTTATPIHNVHRMEVYIRHTGNQDKSDKYNYLYDLEGTTASGIDSSQETKHLPAAQRDAA
jgi:hypothetical protein